MIPFTYKATLSETGAPGAFLELIDVTTRKCYGTLVLTPEQFEANAQRLVGFYGQRQVTFTEPFEMQRGHKIVRVAASKTKPKVCWEHIYPSE